MHLQRFKLTFWKKWVRKCLASLSPVLRCGLQHQTSRQSGSFGASSGTWPVAHRDEGGCGISHQQHRFPGAHTHSSQFCAAAFASAAPLTGLWAVWFGNSPAALGFSRLRFKIKQSASKLRSTVRQFIFFYNLPTANHHKQRMALRHFFCIFSCVASLEAQSLNLVSFVSKNLLLVTNKQRQLTKNDPNSIRMLKERENLSSSAVRCSEITSVTKVPPAMGVQQRMLIWLQWILLMQRVNCF